MGKFSREFVFVLWARKVSVKVRTRYVKGIPFVNGRYSKGVPFLTENGIY